MLDINKINIPKKPGCYLMKNSDRLIIYIGKAQNLDKRVRNYFSHSSSDDRAMIPSLVREIKDIEFIVTRNELEALILEARLVKQHKPKYNSTLKENQPYMYIKITDEEFPRLTSSRYIDGPGKYFGPFISGRGRKYLILTTARLFGIRTDKFVSKSAKELYTLLSEIKEKDLANIDKRQYKRNLRLAEMFLRGRRVELLKELEKKMKTAAAEENFEYAKLVKDQIEHIRRYADSQLISLPKSFDQDVLNYVKVGEQVHFQIFNVSKGVVSSRQSYEMPLETRQSIDSLVYGFIQQYYLTRPVPKELIVPEHFAEEKIISEYLSEMKGQKVHITVPTMGDKRKLLDLVKENIMIRLDHRAEQELQNALGLAKLPLEIDGFDISNISGEMSVGSCVHISHGKPNKSLYRKFKIKTVEGPDDFASMKEIVARRYLHEDWPQPDLILIDGGKGQLSMAVNVLDALHLDIPVISLAKKEEEIFVPGRPESIRLDKKSAGLKLLQLVRDESHRFAKKYHLDLRGRRLGN